MGGTVDQTVVVGDHVEPTDMIRRVVDAQSARYNSFIQNFAGGFMETALEMYRWLLLPVLLATPEELEDGLGYAAIGKCISANHPAGKINPGNVTQALLSTAALQVKLGITPIILDYDQSTRRLDVVDRGFLIWVGHQNKDDLLDAAGLPTGDPPRA